MPNVIPTVTTPVSRQYIGARYIPIIDGDWDNTKDYEPLTVVYYAGASYTSMTYVPSGIDISNTNYWALSADYNAQVAYYRNEVLNFEKMVKEGMIMPEMFGAEGDGLTDDTVAIQSAIDFAATKNATLLLLRNYLVTNTLDVKCNINGNGLIKWDGNNSPVLKVAKLDYISINGISINGNHKASHGILYPYYSSHIIKACAITNCKITGCITLDTQSNAAGIQIESWNKSVIISGNTITDMFKSTDYSVTGQNTAVGILVREIDNNAIISDNHISQIITDHTADADGIIVFTRLRLTNQLDRAHIVISNNYVTQCSGRFVKIQGHGAVVQNNYFENNDIAIITEACGIQSQTDGATIENNIFRLHNMNTGYMSIIRQDFGSNTDESVHTVVRNNSVVSDGNHVTAFCYVYGSPISVKGHINVQDNKVINGNILVMLAFITITEQINVLISNNIFTLGRVIGLSGGIWNTTDPTEQARINSLVNIFAENNISSIAIHLIDPETFLTKIRQNDNINVNYAATDISYVTMVTDTLPDTLNDTITIPIPDGLSMYSLTIAEMHVLYYGAYHRVNLPTYYSAGGIVIKCDNSAYLECPITLTLLNVGKLSKES